MWVGGTNATLSARSFELPKLPLKPLWGVPIFDRLIIPISSFDPPVRCCHEIRSPLQCFAMGTPDIGARENFVRSVSRPARQINLSLSCLYIAAESVPHLDVPLYMGKISHIAERIRQNSQVPRSLYDGLYALNDLIFDDLGFRGNAGDYYDIRNSLLNEVIDRKLGIPITLSVLYMEIGSRIGIHLTGVNMTGHFLLSAGSGDALVFIDPFRNGRLYSRWECLRLLSGSDEPPNDSSKLDRLERAYLPRTDNKMILARVLNNMKMIHTHWGDLESAIADAERIQYVMPWNWRNVGDIAHLMGRSGRAREAYDMLSRMIQMMPPHEDVKLQLDSLEKLKPLAKIDGLVDPEKIHEIPFFRI